MPWPKGVPWPRSRPRKFTEEHCRRISEGKRGGRAWNKGKRMSDSYRETCRRGALGKPNRMRGMHFPERARRNMSVGQRRRYQREEERELARARMVGKTASEETRRRLAGVVHPFRDTKIEVRVQRLLTAIDIPYKKHRAIAGVLPHQYKYHRFDIVLEESKTIIEVNGCYWHGCPLCFPDPTSNQQGWMERDRNIRWFAEGSGWTVIWLWEHKLEKMDDEEVKKMILELPEDVETRRFREIEEERRKREAERRRRGEPPYPLVGGRQV